MAYPSRSPGDGTVAAAGRGGAEVEDGDGGAAASLGMVGIRAGDYFIVSLKPLNVSCCM